MVKKEFIHIDRIKDEVAVLIKNYSNDRRIIISFLLSTFLNNISKKRKGYTLFGKNRQKIVFILLDIIFYIYAFFPSFEQSRKIISIISYINNEIDFINCPKNRNRLRKIINNYSFIFSESNIFDICDWFPMLHEYKISLNVKTEDILLNKAIASNDPIIFGNLLIYSQYNKNFSADIIKKAESHIYNHIKKISEAEIMMQDEFWYTLVFHNCPYISDECRSSIDSVISKVRNNIGNQDFPSSKITKLLCNFLDEKDSSGKKYTKSFFNWDGYKNFAEQITYRTYQRTIFKKYNKNPYKFGSLD